MAAEDLQNCHMGQTYDSLFDDRAVHAKGCLLDYHSSRLSSLGVGRTVNVLEIYFGASLRELVSSEASVIVVLLQGGVVAHGAGDCLDVLGPIFRCGVEYGLRDCLGCPDYILQRLGCRCHNPVADFGELLPDAACVESPEDHHAVEGDDQGVANAARVEIVGGDDVAAAVVGSFAPVAAAAVAVVAAAASEVDTAAAEGVEAAEAAAAADSPDAAAELPPRPTDLPVHIFWEKL